MTIDWTKDYYAILQVPRFANAAELKASYRNLAKKFHPDINPGNKAAEERFKEISNAYDVLSDEQNKLIYDNKLRNPYAHQQQQYRQQQRSQYEQFQREQYEAYLRQQQRARENQKSREAENARPNYDISPWRVIFIVLIIINLLRMCTHRPLIP